MTEPTTTQKNWAFTLLNLQTAYTNTFGSGLPEEEKRAKLAELQGKYAEALLGFTENRQ